jgi:hypothetical protein
MAKKKLALQSGAQIKVEAKVEATKPLRSTQEIKQEYTNTSAQLGDLQYNYDVVMPRRICETKDKMEKLGDEFAIAAQAEALAAQPKVQ